MKTLLENNLRRMHFTIDVVSLNNSLFLPPIPCNYTYDTPPPPPARESAKHYVELLVNSAAQMTQASYLNLLLRKPYSCFFFCLISLIVFTCLFVEFTGQGSRPRPIVRSQEEV